MQFRDVIYISAQPESKFDEEVQEELLRYSRKIADALHLGLTFNENFNAQIKSYTTNAAANTEDTVAHTIKRVPTGFIVLNRDKAGVLYDSGTAWTASNLYLKCSVASVAVKILIF